MDCAERGDIVRKRGESALKKEYSQEDVERILKGEAKIPKRVEEGIQAAYRELGLMGNAGEPFAGQNRMSGKRAAAGHDHIIGKHSPAGRKKIRRKSRKVWAAAAAAAVLTTGLGVTAFAVSQLLKVDLVEKDDKLVYDIHVEPETKEAHQIKVEPTYVPEGYEYQTDGPYQEKWHNYDNDGGMTLIPYNAADLARIEASGSYGLFAEIDKDDYVKSVDIDGMSVDLFSGESIYTDDDESIQNVFVFNEDNGYAVHVHVSGDGLADGEALKVAEGLKITVLDETVPYPTEEELAKIRQETADDQESTASVAYDLHKTGEEILYPEAEDYPITYKVTDIRIEDSLSLDRYPKENYIADYDSAVAPLLNSDGTLKTHGRYTVEDWGVDEDSLENVSSKFVVAQVEVTNKGTDTMQVQVGPNLALFRPNGSGGIERYSYEAASRAYGEIVVDGLPMYQEPQTSDGKEVLLTDIDSGETVTATLVYVVDEDTVDDAYLSFFNMSAGSTQALVKVQE